MKRGSSLDTDPRTLSKLSGKSKLLETVHKTKKQKQG